MRKIIQLLLSTIFLLIISHQVMAQDSSKKSSKVGQGPNTKVVYKQRQKIDLEDISIQGEFVTPGDFTIDKEKTKESNMIYRRKNYKNKLSISIIYVY